MLYDCIVKGTWAYVAVGGMTLKCIRPLWDLFLTTRIWRALFSWEEWNYVKPFNLISLSKRYVPIAMGICLLSFFHIEKTVKFSHLEFIWILGKSNIQNLFKNKMFWTTGWMFCFQFIISSVGMVILVL